MYPFLKKMILKKSLNHQNNANKCTQRERGRERKWDREGGKAKSPSRKLCLLLVVVFAVKFPFSEVTAVGEGLLTHGALQTLFMPRGIVDSHQEAVGDGTLASFTHGSVMTFSPWEKAQEFPVRKKGNRPESRTAISDNW